jgi:REP element-mobilizing transposase RayT
VASEHRIDFPGAWLHVMLRALARRPLFEGTADVRDFLSGLARAARRGDIEVHAYAIVTTHAHLLLRSPRGVVSRALQRVLSDYVRRFNRRRDRDGPLLRSRFRSKVVRSERYRVALVRYIDANVPDARLQDAAGGLGLSSRVLYGRRKGPAWLTRGFVEAAVSSRSGRAYDPVDYDRAFGGNLPRDVSRLVEAGIARGDRDGERFEDLLDAAQPGARRWLERNAVLADGSHPRPMLAPAAVVRAIVARSREADPWSVRTGRRRDDGWRIVEAALLRALAGEGQESVARRMGISRGSFRALCAKHLDRVERDPTYAAKYREAMARISDRLQAKLANFPPRRIG